MIGPRHSMAPSKWQWIPSPSNIGDTLEFAPLGFIRTLSTARRFSPIFPANPVTYVNCYIRQMFADWTTTSLADGIRATVDFYPT